MKRTLSVMAVALAGVLALAGCSSPTESAEQNQQTRASQPASAQADGQAASPQQAASPAAAGSATNLTVASAESGSRLITAQGIGTVSGTPDVVTVSLGVETNSNTAQAALEENNRLAADVITVLKDNGVAAEDLQTSQLSVNPNYDDKNTITGYQVTNMVTAKLRDITKAGAMIDAVGKSAGDAVRVQQLSFSIDDDSALRATARANAVTQAQAQVQQMADAAGVALGPIHTITESPTSTPIAYPAAASLDAAAGAAVPIEAGSQELRVVVQVAYEIAQ